MIFVAQNIPDTHDLQPRNRGLGCKQIRGDAPCGFRNNFDSTLDAMPDKPVVLKFLKRFAMHRRFDSVDGIEDCAERRTDKFFHLKDLFCGRFNPLPQKRVKAVSGRNIDSQTQTLFQKLLYADEFDQ